MNMRDLLSMLADRVTAWEVQVSGPEYASVRSEMRQTAFYLRDALKAMQAADHESVMRIIEASGTWNKPDKES